MDQTHTSLPGEFLLLEYIWVGAAGTLQSQTRVVPQSSAPLSVEQVPALIVASDGHGQAGEVVRDSILKPRKIFLDPFRASGGHMLVLCDAFVPQLDLMSDEGSNLPALPHPCNSRAACSAVLECSSVVEEQPLFACEQQFLVQPDPVETAPSSWPHAHLPDPSSPHLYGPLGSGSGWAPAALRGTAFARAAAARKLSETHLQFCLHAGLKITGCGEGDGPGVWSYKLGPMSGLDLGDELWVSRHLLIRLAEAMGIPVSFAPEAQEGAGRMACHIKYSTAASRQPGHATGLAVIQQHMGLLQASHVNHMQAYGRANRGLMMPLCGVGASSAACLILPTSSALRRCGHLVDRRPAPNVDPWTVTMLMVASTLGPVLGCAGVTQPAESQAEPCAVAPLHPSGVYTAAVAKVPEPETACSSPGDMFSTGAHSQSYSVAHSEEFSDLEDSCDSLDSCSLGGTCSEDLLLEELDRMDGFPDCCMDNDDSLGDDEACSSARRRQYSTSPASESRLDHGCCEKQQPSPWSACKGNGHPISGGSSQFPCGGASSGYEVAYGAGLLRT